MYFDTHCHLNFPDSYPDIEDILKQMEEEKTFTTVVGTDLATSKKALEIADQSDQVFACLGIHPDEMQDFNTSDFQPLFDNPKTRAVGECGLDYFRLDPSEFTEVKKRQVKIFEQQIAFATDKDLPIMIHARPTKGTLDAYQDILEILESWSKTHNIKGNAHFFAGDEQIAKRFLKLGFNISFTGVITFTKDYDELIKYIPLDRLMSETDAPFVAPVPHRGKRATPLMVKEVVKRMAEIKGLSEEEARGALFTNACQFFGVKEGQI